MPGQDRAVCCGDFILVSETAAQSGAAKRGHLRELGLPTLFGAVVLLVSATLMLGANVSALRGNLASMDHAQRVLTNLDQLEASVLSEEMTVRGYALTGDARFLEYQQNERNRSRMSLAELKKLETAEGSRAAEFAAVERSTSQHREIFGSLPLNGPDRATVVARAIVDDGIRANMRATRRTMETLRTAELSDLSARQHDITNQLERAFFLAVGIIIAAFLLGGVGVWAALLKAPQNR